MEAQALAESACASRSEHTPENGEENEEDEEPLGEAMVYRIESRTRRPINADDEK